MAVVKEDVVKIGFDIDMGDLTRLTSALDDIKKILTGGVGDDAFDEMASEAKRASESVDDIKSGLRGIKPDGLDDTVKGLKQTDEKAEDAHAELKKVGNVAMDKTVSGLKSVVSTLGSVALKAGAVLAKGIAVGAAGVGAVVGQAVMKYADYEQLVGGVDTLFKDASGTVQKNADMAFKTAGLSANDYMETVTSFSASLIQSLGGDTAKAAELSNMAIIDMADNANKMGTDMSSIQDAYQGFAKQNYTMLDNLKLGYGGTQEEMKRLLKDAQAISGVKYDISSYADVVEAIHVIQDNMGIAGTTSKEASETISGSFASMKSAWDNTLTSLVIGGDSFDDCVDNLIDSAKTFGKNIMPAILKALEGVGELIEEIAPIIEAELPGLIDTLLPPLIKAATSLIKALIIALPDIIGTLVDELPGILQQVWLGIREAFGDMPGMDKVEAFFGKIRDVFVNNADVVKKVAGVAIGLIFAFKLLSKLNSFSSLFGGGSGGGGGTGGGFLTSFCNLKVSSVLKGIRNLALVLGGLALLGAALMWVAPYMAQLSDMQSIAEVLIVIGAVGLIGTEMTKLAAKVGNIPVATVAKGVANIAITLVGFGALAAVLMWLAPYMAQLSDLQSIAKVLLVIGVVGLVGAALASLAGTIGNIPVATVTKGVANIAIALVGFGALAAVLMWLAPYIDQLGDLQTTFKILIIIAAVGLIGSALAALAGLIGAIPIAAVTTGLANIALALGGFTAIVAAFGALSKIDGFTEFLTSGGEVLAELCRIIGEMAGSIIGGLAEGITNSLPQIGENLSAFATALQPMFETFAGVDATGLGDFAKSLAAFIAVIAGEKIVSVITGGIDYADLGAKLSSMATSLSTFFTTITTFPDGCFEKATALFDCLANISSLPKEGGVVGWFQGEVNFANMATGLNQLAGTVGFFTAIQNIPETAFANATKLFDCLAGIKSLPKDGGVVGWFTGEVNFATIASGIQSLASEGMVSALMTLSTIPVTAFASLTGLFDALAGIKSMPKEGGIFGWFTGDSTTGLKNVTSQLPGVATDIASFFSNLGGRTDFSPIKTLFDTLSNIEIDSDVADRGLLGLGSSDLDNMGTGLSSFATKAKTFFDTINTLNLDNMSGFFAELSTVGDLPEALSTLDTTIGTSLSTLVTTVETKMTEIKTAITTGMLAALTAIASYVSMFHTSGVAIMNGLNNGMLSMKGTLIATAESIASSISSTIDSALDINSPSRKTFKSGVFTGEGMELGMQSKIPDLKATAYEMGMVSIPYGSGYSPETDGGTIYNNGGNSEYTTISPVFNLTISGSQDDRSLARKVKRYVSESVKETFESMERKSAVLREV